MVEMEETNFQNRRIVRRRVMEAAEGVEVRRLHILYFISRNGRNEHPHLIRIHHLSKNGVRLRDIKRWLGELRGKDMPDSFAWSYKRRYRTDYVWQDILDDDLLTPISDNEYFLKGSHISSTMDFPTTPMQKEQESAQVHQTTSSKDTGNINLYSSNPSNNVSSSSSSSSSSIQDSSPTFGSETPTSTADTLENNPGGINQESSSPASKSIVLMKKRKTNKVEMIINGKSRSSSCNTAAPSDKPHHRKSHSRGSIFQSLITCGGGGGVETNDSVVTISNKRYKPLFKMCSCDSADGVRDSVKEKGEYRQHGAPRAAYRPLYGPNCSQCGKTFKPEKLHSHMSSCKGMKALAKKSKASTDEDSGSAYILAQNC